MSNKSKPMSGNKSSSSRRGAENIGPMPTPSDFLEVFPDKDITPSNCQLRKSKVFILMDWEASKFVQHPPK